MRPDAAALISQLQTELGQCREQSSVALQTAFATVADLRRQLAEAQELIDKTQSDDPGLLKQQIRQLKDELAGTRKEEALMRSHVAELEKGLAVMQTQTRASQKARSKSPVGSGKERSALRGLSPNKSDAAPGSPVPARVDGDGYEQRYRKLHAEHRAMIKEHEKDRQSWRVYKSWMRTAHPELCISPSKSSPIKAMDVSPTDRPRASPHRAASPRSPDSPKLVLRPAASPPRAPTPVAGPSKATRNKVLAVETPTPDKKAGESFNMFAELGSPGLPAAQWDLIDKEDNTTSVKKRSRKLYTGAEADEAMEKQEAKRRRRSSMAPGGPDSARKGADDQQKPKKKKSDRYYTEEPYPGQHYLDEVRRKRKEEVSKDPGKYKLRKSEIESPARLDDEFEIDPERNEGRDYAFNEVVRNRKERKKLHGADCDCCKDYYMRAHDGDKEKARQHAQNISRHRAQVPAPPSPPDYWQMGFPDTQQVDDINRRAELQRQERAELKAAEVDAGRGRYRRKE